MKVKTRANGRETRLHRLADRAALAELSQFALLGDAALQFVVGAMTASAEVARTNWLTDAVTDEESGTPLGPVARSLWPVITDDNAVHVHAEKDTVVLSFRATAPSPGGGPQQALPELDLYCHAEDVGGRAALEAFGILAAATWPEALTFTSPGEAPFPRFWSGPADLCPDVVHSFAHRFLRLPYTPVFRTFYRDGVVRISVHVGTELAHGVARDLDGHVWLNHVDFWNRVVERVEPEAGPRDMPRLDGPKPLLLECVDVDSGRRFVDARYARADTDPSGTVQIVPTRRGQQWTLAFPTEPVPAQNLRVAWLRWLDWTGLTLSPGRSRLMVHRTPRFGVRTATAPSEPTSAFRQVRDALQALPSRLHEDPFGTPTARLAALVWSHLPAGLRPWIDAETCEEFPFGLGLSTVVRAVPHCPVPWGMQPGTATLTHRIALRLRDHADATSLQSLIAWLERIVESRLQPPGQRVEILMCEGGRP